MTAPHKAELALAALAAYLIAILQAQHGLGHLLAPIMKALSG